MSFQLAPPKYLWKNQDILLDTQAPPTINVWYTIATLTGGVRLELLRIKHDNTSADSQDMEVRITVDDQAPQTVAISGNDDEDWCLWREPAGIDWGSVQAADVTAQRLAYYDPTATAYDNYYVFLEAHSVTIEARMVSLGTNEQLITRVKYSLLKPM